MTSNERTVPGVGLLVHDLFWTKQQQMTIFRQEKIVPIKFDGELGEELETEQIAAYIRFFKCDITLLEKAEISIYKYYLSIMPEYRDIYGEQADQYAPLINDKFDIGKLVSFRSVYFPYSFNSGDRIAGLLFDCKWEEEHGLAVKFINEEIAEVGYQDIIL